MRTKSDDPWSTTSSRRLLEQIDGIAETITATIRADLPGYGIVPVEEHHTSVREQISIIITGLRDGRPPDSADLTKAEQLGRRRAEQGLALSTLLQSYEPPARELWSCYAAQVRTGQHAKDLIALVPTLLAWLHQIGSAAADGHQLIAASRLANTIRLQAELLELITSDPSSAQCSHLTTKLGMDPTGSFHAVGFAPGADPHELERLQIRLRLNAKGVIAAMHRSIFIVLQQEDRTEIVEQLCRPHAQGGVLGLGQRRDGLTGARLSIGDAERAVTVARGLGHDVAFAEHWLLAAILASAEHLSGLDAGVREARANPHLAQTVLAYADNGCSAAATARALHMHPNTVAYRLERWSQLTRWNLQDFEGLARSVVAVGLASVPIASRELT